MRATICTSAMLVLAACQTESPGPFDEKRIYTEDEFRARVVGSLELSDRIHDLVMQRETEYTGMSETKAMAVCIRWDSPTPPRIQILGAFATHTGITSDKPIFTPRLRRDALNRCKGWAAFVKVDCTCHELDEDGKNVLRVP